MFISLAVLSGTASFAQLPDAAAIAAKMYPGWNLGNTMEANNSGKNFENNIGLAGETQWQGTKTTQEVIDYVKSQGFKSVRIPCNWVCGHISNASDNTIDAAWMSRVKEVVDYCINAGLYVLLNDHYDGGWVETSFTDVSNATIEKNSAVMKAIWTQIANAFKDYDEHLLFGGLNEPNCDNQNKTNALVKYEQAFIDAVRSTGGNNTTRTLVVQGPSTDIDNTNRYYTTLPTDPTANRLMVEVHFYSPWQFCGLEEDASWGSMWYFWGSANHVSGGTWSARNSSSSNEENFVKSQFQKMKTQFVDKGIPVIIGEYGCQWRNVANSSAQKKHDASVKLFHKTVNQQAIENGLIPFVWDINVQNQNGLKGIMSIINRSAKSIYCSCAMEGITEGVEAASKWGGPTTGIAEIPFVEKAGAENAPAYNLSGQRVRRDSKGIIIVGGKKYMQN
ncbi:MAG: glycoside hydrolase family 5 protein [Prevotella sp.]|nr:glycoside hydrolase family 5 protein [Prevotella sp.]